MPEPLPAPGDVVWIRQQRWRVERARRTHHVVCLDVTGRGRALTFLAPFDRPVAVSRSERLRYARPQQALARLARLAAGQRRVRTPAVMAGADAAILPHQLEPALALLDGARRVLIADEVGLGKTIEAGLAIAELVERRRFARVLVVAPAALRRQWADELRRRFHLPCAVADAPALERHGRAASAGDTPWRRSGIWIASLDYLKQPHVFDALPALAWDLLVVDEAHTACGDSARHDALDDLARRARHLLLLTATPHGGDEIRFTRLTTTGALEGLDDPLLVFRRTREELGLQRNRRVRWHPVGLSNAETHLFDVLTAFEAAVLDAAGMDRRDAALLLLSVFRKRALSTMSALVTSINRRLQWIGDRGPDVDDGIEWLQPRLQFNADSDVADAEECESLRVDIGLGAGHERSWLRRLRVLAETARRDESKIRRLVALLARSREPVAVFTEFRHSLEAVRGPLEQVRSVAVLHGGLAPGDQHVALDRFLSGAASVLLATDVASLGLNLHTRSRWVVSLELPWNPARLEQRAGRVDRIGQTRSVHVTLLVASHEAERGVLTRLARRTLAARQALGDDLLRGAVPDDARVRAALLAGAPLDDAAPPAAPIGTCRRWTRHARLLCRSLGRRRALGRRWRAPAGDRSGSRWTTLDRLPRLRALSPGDLLVFSVPIVERSGDVVEWHLVATTSQAAARGHPAGRGVIERARQLAAAALAARAARVRRLRIGALERAVACERAIARALVASRCPEEVQNGLFDRRAARRSDEARRDVDALRDDCARRVRELEDAVRVDVGRPVLELILAGRR